LNTKCIIALGNPGQEYRDTRHNVAQRVFSELERQSVLSWETKHKLHAEICFWVPNEVKKKFMLIKPTVFMNESGKTVNNVCAYFGIKPDEILVLHDELDLVPGTAKIQFGGSAAGHNGVLDIYKSFGNQKFKRMRIGIGHPRALGLHQSVSNFVLQRPSEDEGKAIGKVVNFCSNFLVEICQKSAIEANCYFQQGVKKWD